MKSSEHKRLKRLIALSLLGVNAFVLVVLAFFLHESRGQYADKAVASAQNLARVLELQVNASVRQFDISLRSAGDVILRGLAEGRRLPELRLHGLLTQYLARMPEASQLLLFDEHGEVIAASGFTSSAGLSMAGQAFFRRLRDDNYSGLVVGDPYGEQHRLMLPFVRRVANPDGSFAGGLVLLAEIERFTSALAEVQVGSRGRVSLLDARLQRIVSYPRERDESGSELPELSHVPEGDVSRVEVGGDQFIVALRKSSDWPFFVSVDLLAADYLAGWRKELQFSIAAYLLFLLFGTLLAYLIGHIWRSNLRTQQENLRLLRFNEGLLAAIPIPVFFKDRSGHYLGCNPAYSEVMGLSSETLCGRTPLDFWPGELAATYLQKDAELMNGGPPQVYEYLIRDRHGSLRQVLFARNTFLDANDEIAGIIGTFVDISEQKRHERELLEARQAAESANLAKSRFLATMSHEIRTPLNGILGIAQIMQMNADGDDEAGENARIILESGQTLLNLLNDILDLSKIEAGKLELDAQIFDPALLIEETMALFADTARQKGLLLRGEWPAGGECLYRADPLRLRQILANLISNAVKFSQNGEVIVAFHEEQAANQVCLLYLEVRDCGIGISPEQQQHLFQPFSQVDSSATRKFGGSGLGLSIVRNLAEIMHGEVGVHSEPGSGSTFWVRVRVEPVVGQLPASLDVPPRQANPVVPLSEARILVADDNAINRQVVTTLLHKAGYLVECVENGQQALARMKHGPELDLVLMDCQMPVMDGFAATRAIRSWEVAQHVRRTPIVAFTAGVFAEERQLSMAAGMDDFLPKPVDAALLTAILEKWLAAGEICD